MKLRISIAVAAVFALIGVMIGGPPRQRPCSPTTSRTATPTGWSKSGGDWSVVADGSPALRQTKLDSELARQFAGSTSWTNYTVQARVKPLASAAPARFVGIAARSTGATTSTGSRCSTPAAPSCRRSTAARSP